MEQGWNTAQVSKNCIVFDGVIHSTQVEGLTESVNSLKNYLGHKEEPSESKESRKLEDLIGNKPMKSILPLQNHSSMIFTGETDDKRKCFIQTPLSDTKLREILPKHFEIESMAFAANDVVAIVLKDNTLVHLNLNGMVVDQADDKVKKVMNKFKRIECES